MLNVTTTISEPYEISIFGLDGKSTGGEQRLTGNGTVNMQHLSQGVYLLQLSTATNTYISKVLR